MLDKHLVAFGNAYNFNFDTDYAYGVIGGYTVSVSNVGSKKAAFINCFFPLEEEGGLSEFELSGAISALQLEALKNCEISESGVYFVSHCSLSDFDEAVLALTKLLDESGIDGVGYCTDCGCDLESHESKASVVNGRVTVLCDECAEAFKQAMFREASANTEKKRSRGVLGAILGGVLGILAMLALFIWMPFSGIDESFGGELVSDTFLLAIPVCALIAVLCFVFFRLFTGIKGNRRMVPCLIISLISSVLATYGATAVLYAKQFGITSETFGKVYGIVLRAPITDDIFRADYLKHTFFGLIAVIIVVLVYSIIFDDTKKGAPAIITLSDTEAAEDEAEEFEAAEEVEEVEEVEDSQL